MKQRWLRLVTGCVVTAVFLTAGAAQLTAKDYAATATQLSANFENALKLLTNAQLVDLKDPIDRVRQRLANMASLAKEIEALQAKLESAKGKVSLAEAAWINAQSLNNGTQRTLDAKIAAWERDYQRYVQDFGDEAQRWGLPRTGGTKEFEPGDPSQATFTANAAALKQREGGLATRQTALQREVQDAAERDQAASDRAQELEGAKSEASDVQDSLSSKTDEFDTQESATEETIQGVKAGKDLPPSDSGPRTSSPTGGGGAGVGPTLVRDVPGANSKTLQQLKGAKAEENKSNCYDGRRAAGCQAGSELSVNGVVVPPPAAIAEQLTKLPGYKEATVAAATAKKEFEEADKAFIDLARSSTTTSSQLQAQYDVRTEAAKKNEAATFKVGMFSANLTPMVPKPPRKPVEVPSP